MSEYWVVWFEAWGGNVPGVNSQTVYDNLNHLYTAHNASINVYMIHGGTNFGFMNGAEESGATVIFTLRHE